MLIERIYDEDLAQASYLIGCQAKGEAVVVDGRRDIAVYQALAEKNGMKIVAVTETHIHADYLSGTRELAAATGAKIYVSGEGGPDWQYGFEGGTAVRRRHDHPGQHHHQGPAHPGPHPGAPVLPGHRRRVQRPARLPALR